MIAGIGFVIAGYALAYWGLHHFPGADCPEGPDKCRYSLLDVFGIPNSWGFTRGQPIRLSTYITDTSTQGQTSTNATTGSPLTGGQSTSWITGILSGIGAPATQNNGNKLQAWNACEGNLNGHSGLGINNPFNTTLDCCGGQSVNSAGVKAYPTMAAGVQATVQTLQSKLYAAIVSNLQNDGSTQAFGLAVGSSPWGTSGGCISSRLQSGVMV